ncbi:transcription repressor OFP7-like [Musa acuminata AAA Group]|uniref:transcription repressor OFP7-like n=1 Tax=Musa acuminata AAA Group TaxID=214697 RepID=UPI0031CDDEEE
MRDNLVHKAAGQIPALIEGLKRKRGRMSTGARKRRSSSFLSLGCGCTDSKSVSVSGSFGSKSTSTLPPARRVAEFSSADTITLTSGSSSFYEEEDVEVKMERSTSTPSFSELLRQLNELEQSVIACGSHAPLSIDGKRDEKKGNRWSSGQGRQGLEDSIVVVKETEDPLGEFRRSMLHMIVEKEIVDGAELRELLRRFLALNSQRHHRTILRAFAEIWDDVFSGYEQTPDLLRHGYSGLPPRRHF